MTESNDDGLPNQNLAFETFSYDLGRIIDRHNLELDTKAWHAGVTKLRLNDLPCLSYLITYGSSFRQTIALKKLLAQEWKQKPIQTY